MGRGKEVTDSFHDGVAVIVPFYRAGRFAADLAKSLGRQSRLPDEVVVVDDGNGEGIDELRSQLANYGISPIIIVTEGRQGPAKARNAGLAATRCQYVVFHDADDLWVPDALQQVVEHTVIYSAPLVCGTPYYFDENGVINTTDLPPLIGFDLLLQTNPIPMSMVFIDRGVVGDILFENCGHEDYRLWLRLAKEYGGFHCVDALLVGMRRTPGSVSSNKQRSAKWHWNALRDVARIGLLARSLLFVMYAINAIDRRRAGVHHPILLPAWLLDMFVVLKRDRNC